MNLRDLQYLTVVAQTKHFGRAATQCFVSQPTLSMQLKKLEDELGVQIFERNNKHVMITPVGEAIVRQAQQVLQQVDALKHLAQNAQDPLAGPFRLGIIPTVAPYLLPRVLPVIQRQLPRLQIMLQEDKTDVITQQLTEGRLDAIIAALPIAVKGGKIISLYQEPFYAALPIDHKLTKKQTISLEDLHGETLLLLKEGHCLRDQALDLCRVAHVKQHKGFEASSLETLREMVVIGSGVTLLPALAVQKEPKRLSVKRFSEPMPYREVGLLYRDFSAREYCCRMLAQLIQAQIKKVLTL